MHCCRILLSRLLWGFFFVKQFTLNKSTKCEKVHKYVVHKRFQLFSSENTKKAKFATTTLSVSLSMHCFAFSAFLLSNTVAVGCFEINPLGYVPKHVFIFIKITYCIWIYFIHNTAKTFFFVLLRVNTNCQFSQAQRNLRISRK